MSCGIYKIQNLINNNCYIGQSKNIELRWKEHKKNKGCLKYPLYLAFQKYKLENFSFEIVEECSQELLNEKEIYWIKKFDSYFNGYNQTLGGNQHSINQKISDEDLFLIINLLQNSKLTQREISKQFNIGEDTVSEINMGKTRIIEEIEYPIRNYKSKKQFFCKICNSPVSKNGNICQKCNGLSQQKVKRPTKEELYKLLKENNFSIVGKIYGISDTTIRRWCISYGIPSKASDYKEPIKLKNKLIVKSIYQYDIQGNFIRKFLKVSEAIDWLISNDGVEAKKDSIKGNIYRVANGERKTAYKYIWKYE